MSAVNSAALFANPLSPRRMMHRVMAWSAGIACGGHLIFLGLLYSAGVYGLAWINVISALFYAMAAINIRRRSRVSLWLYIILIETLGYGVIASFWVGLDTGFYYYMLIVPPGLVLADIRPVALKWVLVVAAVAIVIGNTLWLGMRAPWVPLAPTFVVGLAAFNLACASAIMMFVALRYFRLVTGAHDQLGVIAATDPLTGLLNRRSLIAHWLHNLKRSPAASGDCALLLCDIDHFKSINDRFGHDVGDQVLREVGNRLKASVRASDHVARWGGEEFLVVMPGLDLDTAAEVAESLRARIDEHPVAAAGTNLQVTLTIGVTRHAAAETLDQAIARADAALYRGKREGRNCVQCCAPAAGGDIE